MQLKNLYKNGLNAAEQEERVLRASLSRIYEIRAIKNERRIQVCTICFILGECS